jgi:hypothetical protein
MARSKGDGKSTVEAPPREGGEMAVTLRGTPEEVRAQFTASEADAPPGAPPPGAPVDGGAPSPQRLAYIEALKVPQNTVVVKRISPRNWNDAKVNVEVYREQCPLDPVSIETEIREEFGGRKYRAAVINSETGQVVSAETFEVDADPLIKKTAEEERFEQEILMQGAPPQQDVSEAALERQTRLTAKQIEYEQTRQTLESLKAQQTGGKTDPRLDARIRELEHRTTTQEADRRVAETEERHRREMDELKRQISAQQAPKPQGMEDPLIKMMMEQNKQANERFEKLLTQMNDNRMADIQRQLAEVKNKPQGNNLLEMAESMLKLKEVFGWGEQEDEEDDDDDGEGKPFLEKLADKYLPKVFEMIEDEQTKTGKELSKDEVVARINAAADQAVKEELARRREVAQQAQRSLPAPQQQAAPAPQAAAPAPQAAPAPVAPPQRQVPSIEEEVKIRVASVIAVLERELILRPRGWQWTLACWQALPEELREKISAPGLTPPASIAVFDGIVNQEGLELLKKKLTDDAKAAAWMERGLAELRGWAEELAKDPDFDPTEEEDEEGEEA